MIIGQFNFVGVAVPPDEANAPLVIYANAVAPFTSRFQGFKPIARWHRHLPQFRRRMQGKQFASGATLDARWESAGQFRPEQPRGFPTRKTQNHLRIVTYDVNTVKEH